MVMARDKILTDMNKAWHAYLDALEKSLELLEKDIEAARQMAGTCTSEWCEATELTIDELNIALFSISEPSWSDQNASQKIKQLKKRVYDLYINYRGVYQKVA